MRSNHSEKESFQVLIATILALALAAGVFLFMNAPSPATRVLRKNLAGATEVKVLSNNPLISVEPLHILHGRSVQDFVSALELKDKAKQCYGTCMCNGTHEFKVYKDNKLIGSFYFKDKGRLHSNNGFWKGDLPLSDRSNRYLQNLLKR